MKPDSDKLKNTYEKWNDNSDYVAPFETRALRGLRLGRAKRSMREQTKYHARLPGLPTMFCRVEAGM